MCPYHSGDGVDVDVGMGGGGGGVERGGEEQEEDTAGNPSSMNHTSGLRLQSVSSLSEGVLHGLSLDAQDVALLKKVCGVWGGGGVWCVCQKMECVCKYPCICVRIPVYV